MFNINACVIIHSIFFISIITPTTFAVSTSSNDTRTNKFYVLYDGISLTNVSASPEKLHKTDKTVDDKNLNFGSRSHSLSSGFKEASLEADSKPVIGTRKLLRQRTRVADYNEAASISSYKRDYKVALQNEYLLLRGRRQATGSTGSMWTSWESWEPWSAWNTWSWSGWDAWSNWHDSWNSWDDWDAWNAWDDWKTWNSWSNWNSWSEWNTGSDGDMAAGSIIGIITGVIAVAILIAICCCCCARKSNNPTTTTTTVAAPAASVHYSAGQHAGHNAASQPATSHAYPGAGYPPPPGAAYPPPQGTSYPGFSQAPQNPYAPPPPANNGSLPYPTAPSGPTEGGAGPSAPPPSYGLAVSNDCYAPPTISVPGKVPPNSNLTVESNQKAADGKSGLPTYNEYLQASRENLQASRENLQASGYHPQASGDNDNLQASRDNLPASRDNLPPSSENSQTAKSAQNNQDDSDNSDTSSETAFQL